MARLPLLLIWCAVGLLVWAGCERSYILPAPSFSPIAVVMSHFTTGQPFQVKVSKIMPLDVNASPEYPDNATVEIFAGQTLLGHLQYTTDSSGGAYYQSNQIQPQAGMAYTIKVRVPDLPEAVAGSQVPYPCGISASMEQLSLIDTTGLNNLYEGSIRLGFPCVTGPRDYFQISLKQINRRFNIVNNDTLFLAPDTTMLENYGTNFQGNPYVYAYGTASKVYLFSENAIVGQTVHLNFNVSDDANDPLQEVLLEVRRVSREYYQFYRSLLFQSSPNDQNFFTDPQTFYNNILNGAGNFSGYQSEFVSFPWNY